MHISENRQHIQYTDCITITTGVQSHFSANANINIYNKWLGLLPHSQVTYCGILALFSSILVHFYLYVCVSFFLSLSFFSFSLNIFESRAYSSFCPSIAFSLSTYSIVDCLSVGFALEKNVHCDK